MELSAGTIVAGRFRITGLLGEGGFGAVYEAAELKDGALVALKVLHPEMVSHPTLRERFEQEARIASTIRSAHVVAVVDAGVDGASGRPWVAFERLRGASLDAWLEHEPTPPRAFVVRLFEQLGEAIGAAHEAGVIHADLKPENLFLADPASSPTLKVLDFGIARMLKAGATSTKVTTTMGSPAWTAPEQFLRGSKLRASTDVWPIGMLAFRLLTGQHYLRNATPDGATMALLTEICAAPLPTASARAQELGVASRLPADFDRWFAHCVVRAPGERFQHGRAAVTALLSMLHATTPIPATVVLSAPPISPWPALRGTVAMPTQVVPAVLAMLEAQDHASAQRALAHEPAGPDAPAELWALRGECAQRLGRYEEAVEHWSRAIVRAPAATMHLYGRALAFEALGMRAAAQADLALAAALGHEPARQRLTVWEPTPGGDAR